MIVKDVMNRTSIKHYENDYIEDVAKRIIARGDEGGLVYNERDELTGCFTYKDLLKGIVEKGETLLHVCTRHYKLVNENSVIEEVHFEKNDVCPVTNRNADITGFITKSDYLKAIAKTTKIERNRLDAIFNSAHNGILSIDLEGQITAINPPAEKMALVTKEEAIGKFLTDVVTPSGLLDVIRTGEGHTEKYKVGKRMYLTHRSPIYDEQRLIGAVGVFQDISEIEIVSSELDSVKQLMNEMDTIISHSSDGICIVNAEGEMIKKNHKFGELYFGGLHEARRREDFLTIIGHVVKKGEPYNAIEPGTDGDNSLIITANPVKNATGCVERIVMSVKDMTEIDHLRQQLEKTQGVLKNIQNEKRGTSFVATSKKMKKIVDQAMQLAKVDVTILLTGEKGVGKETIANRIQMASLRKDKPFIKVDCDAISEEQMAYELFGYEIGACPEAPESEKKGLFEQADGGTILLDEIGRIPLPLQVKLLRVLQEQQLSRVGAIESRKINVRIIATTSQNLEALVATQKFREDLYFRINVIPIMLPALRERPEDIPDLVQLYADLFAVRYKKRIQLTEEMMRAFVHHEWPGNIRELVYVLEKIYATLSENRLTEEWLLDFLENGSSHKSTIEQSITVNKVIPLKQAVAELERQLIEKAGETEISYRQIAKVLEVSPSTIIRKVKKREAHH